MDAVEIERILGPAYFHECGCLLYNMDCVEGMTRLAQAGFTRIDLTVTSPPCNIGTEYEDIMPLEEYVVWCEKWLGLIHSVTAPKGSFWLNVGYVPVESRAKALPLTYLLWDKAPFYLIQEVVWNYDAGVAERKFLSPRNEKLLWYVKSAEEYVFNLDDIRDPDVKYPNQKKNGKTRVNPLGKNPSDVWQIPKVTSDKHRASSERTVHSAQFPLALIERVVLASSNAYNMILDPFMGSGTTAEACIRSGRCVVGFEIRADYCKLAAIRIRKTIIDLKSGLAQQQLSFAAPPAKRSRVESVE